MNGSYLTKVYRGSLGLLTDLYELTMAYGYWRQGIAEKPASFNLFFRKRPFEGTYAIVAGIQTILEYIENFHFDAQDLSYLEALTDTKGEPLFEKRFLDYLSQLRLHLDVDAMPEGTAVFPYEPIIRVQGPILQAQILESAVLNIVNFQTLIATKASRICYAARPDHVSEFGLRRAQGIDGAIAASRAAYIGGCHSTSNVLAGKLFGIPLKGTQAHSWIMAFDEEKEAFKAFAEAFPNSCLFLIDTYDSIEGVKHAIEVANELKAKGIEFLGVRLDSGDLTHLSIEVRKILDEAGYPKTQIMASNELDEYLIMDLKHQGSVVTIWGVGTNLVTGKGQPALDGVYKLSAIQDKQGKWQYRLKISEQIAKVTNPGISQVRRFFDQKGNIADMIYDIHLGIPEKTSIVDIADPTIIKRIDQRWKYKDLLVPMMRQGKSVYATPSLEKMRDNTYENLNQLHPAMRRFLNPQPYFFGLEESLYQLKRSMIEKIREGFYP